MLIRISISDVEASKRKLKRHNDSLDDQITKKNSKSSFKNFLTVTENENTNDQLDTSIEI